MQRKILIINGNPARKRHSLCAAIADSYGLGASGRGAHVTRIDLKDLAFDLILHEGYNEEQPLEPDLVMVRDAMMAADHHVFIFPLWHGMTPALFKAFLDRLITVGFAFTIRDGLPVSTQVLSGKTAEIILTCGMPAIMYHWLSGAHASKALSTILKMCGVRMKDVTAFGLVPMTEDKTSKRCSRYLERSAKLGARAA